MLTRRKALGLLPVGLLLDANFSTDAQAEGVTSKRFPFPTNQKIYEIITTTREPWISIEEFANRINTKLGVDKFKDHKNITIQILRYLRNVFDYNNTLSPEQFKYFLGDAGSGSGAIGSGTSQVKDFILLLLGEENNDATAFAKELNRLKSKSQQGWPTKEELEESIVRAWGEKKEMNDFLNIITEKSREISRYLSERPERIRTLQQDDDANDTNLMDRKKTYKEWLYPRAEDVWRAGYDAARLSPLAFPIAAQAFGTHHFILRLFRDGRNYGALQSRHRALSMHVMAVALDFFDAGLFKVMSASNVVKTMLKLNSDNFQKDAKGVFLGTELWANEISEGKVSDPAINIPISDRGDPPQQRDVQVWYVNYYLEAKGGRFTEQEATAPYFFTKIPISEDEVVRSEFRNKLNDRARPTLITQIPHVDGVEARSNEPIAENVSGTTRSSHAANLNTFSRLFIRNVDKRMDDVMNNYRDVIVVFNCQERMANSIMTMLGYGGSNAQPPQ